MRVNTMIPKMFAPPISGSIPGISLSQMSDCSQSSSISPDRVNYQKIFMNRIRQASVVLLVLSAEYINSRTSRKQVSLTVFVFLFRDFIKHETSFKFTIPFCRRTIAKAGRKLLLSEPVTVTWSSARG